MDSPWCFRRASINSADVLNFNSDVEHVEKNWNILRIVKGGDAKRVYVEYGLEPHQVYITTHIRVPGRESLVMSRMDFVGGAKWPLAVLNGVSNVRGGYCCVEIPNLGYLGLGHLVRIRQ